MEGVVCCFAFTLFWVCGPLCQLSVWFAVRGSCSSVARLVRDHAETDCASLFIPIAYASIDRDLKDVEGGSRIIESRESSRSRFSSLLAYSRALCCILHNRLQYKYYVIIIIKSTIQWRDETDSSFDQSSLQCYY
jgi:hypothetical protein